MDRSDTYHDTSLTIRYVSRYFKYRRLEVQNRFIQGTNCILVVLPLYFNEVSHNLHMTRPFSSPHTFLLEHRHPKYLPDSRFAAWGSNQLHPTFGHLQHFLFSLSFSFLKNTDLNEEIFSPEFIWQRVSIRKDMYRSSYRELKNRDASMHRCIGPALHLSEHKNGVSL